ncbi:MAG: efflux RND transporter periplasmic adaptor subunit [Gammaproteobacteria bacterium]|nr:efflux RND transporter periplasmic adaptor subunit [Gammaproteobacteria bacterium]MXY58463.1 efflux RND transporter periplasmic adaptor subunit [Gammaproteobacteria bacterium]MYF31357.1 efflux RND transporter periplasmic adaptor subunit [Gammaproteobacteria bacterium]MYK46194.1 efflux RND transporter periplasmic adaptor subunit [Gammaproteobacteria bacterium]
MRKTHLTALLIVVATAIWLMTGYLGGVDAVADHPSISDLNARTTANGDDREPTVVRARTITASAYSEQVKIRGHTENKRTVEVRAETQGRVVERPVERGTAVDAGDLLCRLAVEDRQAQVNQAQEAVNQARIEHEGSLRLKDGGFQSRTAIAQAKSRLASAEAQLEAAALDYERTFIRAPFGGVVEQTLLEIGDYAQPATPCARVVDLDPMLLVGQVSERDVARLANGGTATGVLVSGETATGIISFIGHQADPSTRTYRVEATVPNPHHRLLSGATADIAIVVGEVDAHQISPAVLALDDGGQSGVHTVEADGRVRFRPVTIVADGGEGVWVTGLPETVTLITVGHQLVVDGERVEVRLERGSDTAPQASQAPSNVSNRIADRS